MHVLTLKSDIPNLRYGSYLSLIHVPNDFVQVTPLHCTIWEDTTLQAKELSKALRKPQSAFSKQLMWGLHLPRCVCVCGGGEEGGEGGGRGYMIFMFRL